MQVVAVQSITVYMSRRLVSLDTKLGKGTQGQNTL